MHEELVRAYQRIFNNPSPEVQLIMDDLREQAFFDQEIFDEGNERKSTYLLGRRSMILHIDSMRNHERNNDKDV